MNYKKIYNEKKNKYPKRIKWTIEICKKYASQYETRNEFRKGCNRAYTAARKNGWLDEVCSHMITLGDKYKRLIYAFEFENNSVYIGLTNNHIRRYKEHTSTQNTTVKKYINKTGLTPKFKLLTDYVEVDKATVKESEFVKTYKSKGWNILNKVKTGGIGKVDIMWDFESCKKEALKYNTRNGFKKGSYSAYTISVRNGWMDEICSHMLTYSQVITKWTYEICKEEALKYTSRSEFYINNQSAYKSSLRNGWLDEFFPKRKKG